MHVPIGVPLVFVAVEAKAAAVYSVIASPPFAAGALHVTAAVVPLNDAPAPVGAPGATTATGDVTKLDNELNEP